MILGSSNLWTGLFIAPVGAGFTRSPITEIYGPPLHPALPYALSPPSPLSTSGPGSCLQLGPPIRAVSQADPPSILPQIGQRIHAAQPERINAD